MTAFIVNVLAVAGIACLLIGPIMIGLAALVAYDRRRVTVRRLRRAWEGK